MMLDDDSDTDFDSEVAAWRRVGTAFNIVVHAPYELVVEGRTHVCVAFLPAFGSERGMLVRCGRADVQFMNDANTFGIGFTHINLASTPRGERYIIEMLSDWGFTGAGAPPEWLCEAHDHHGHGH